LELKTSNNQTKDDMAGTKQVRGSAEAVKEFNAHRRAAGILQHEAVDQALKLWIKTKGGKK